MKEIINKNSRENFKQNKLWVYYLCLIFIGIFPDAMISSPLSISIMGMNFYSGDILNTFVMLTFFLVVLSDKNRKFFLSEKTFSLLIGMIVISLITGIFKYSYRAIGELRYYIPVFTVFTAYFLTQKFNLQIEDIFNIIKTSLRLLAWLSVTKFIVSTLFLGLGKFDFRDLKVLGTNESFFIGAFMVWLLVKPVMKQKLKPKVWIEIIILFVVLILSENRAALASIIISFSLVTLLLGKIRLKLGIFAFAIISIIILILKDANPQILNNLILSYQGIINPSSDPNGNWRILVQSEAIMQGLKTFWLGQGLGGYFYFVVPGLINTEAYPHSQYILLFLTSGIISALCAVGIIISYFIRYIHYYKYNKIIKNSPELLALVIIIFSQLFYGLAYVFVPIFGILYGWGVITTKKITSNFT